MRGANEWDIFLPITEREHKIHIVELTCDADDGVFDDFSKISDHFPKILQKCSEGQTTVREHFAKISEDFQRIPKTGSRLYTNEFKYNII